MNKVNAQHLANTARSLVSLLQDNCKATIAGTITEWNTCVKQAGFFGVFDFPTTGYTRKAQLKSDLIRCFEQLDDFEEGADLVHDVDAAHAEALEIYNALALAKIADECIYDLKVGAAKNYVLANWNAAARHGGFPLLAIRSDFVYYPHAALIQTLNLRKTVLDIKVNP